MSHGQTIKSHSLSGVALATAGALVLSAVAPLEFHRSSLRSNVPAPAIQLVAAVSPSIPEIYVTTLQGLVTAGFNLGSAAIRSVNDIAQIGPLVVDVLVNSAAVAAETVTSAAAYTASGILAALQMPDQYVNWPITAATIILDVIVHAAVAVLSQTHAVANWLQETADNLISANNGIGEQINAWLGGLIGSSGVAPAGASATASVPLKRQANVTVAPRGVRQDANPAGARAKRPHRAAVARTASPGANSTAKGRQR